MNVNVKRILKKIHNASEQGSLSFFVGAGVSMLSGQPSWTELLNNIKSICDEVVKKNVKNGDVDKLIDLVLEDKKKNKITNSIRDIKSKKNTDSGYNSSKDNYAKAQVTFDALGCSKEKFSEIVKFCFNENAEANEIHDKILSLNPASIITTNFDNLIEAACNSKYENYVTVASDDEVSSIQGRHFILKIHGDFEHKNIVFTEDSYLDYERNFSLISRILTSILATNTVVFIGYSLSDFNIRLLVNLLKPLYQKIEKDKRSLKYRKASKIIKNDTRPIFYSVGKQKLSYQEKQYLNNKGIDVLDCYDLRESDPDVGYNVHYSDLFLSIEKLIQRSTIDDLYNCLLPLDEFDAISIDLLLDKLRFFNLDINAFYFNLTFSKGKFETYQSYLQGKKITENDVNKCRIITKIFIKAGVEYVFLENYQNKVDLNKKNDTSLLHKYSNFYDALISFNYKKLEVWSRRKRKYKFRNIALLRLGKLQQLYSSIQQDFQKLYPKKLSEIDFYIFKLNFDYASLLSEREQKYVEDEEKIIRERKQLNKNECSDKETIVNVNISDEGSVRNDFDENRLSETNKSEESIKTINKTNLVDLNKINASKLFDNMSIEFRTKYPFMKNWLDCPFSKRNINTIHSVCNRINSLKENNSVSTFDYSNLSLKYVVKNLHFLIANGILNDKSINWKNTVIDVLRAIVTKIDVSALEKKSFLEIQDVVVFDYKIFFLYIEFFSSKDLISLFKFNKIRKLYCGVQNEELNSIEKSIKNLLNYARQNEDDFKDSRLKDHGMHLVQKVKNLIVICSYLSISTNTINNLVDFILNYPSLLCDASEEVYLFLSSIFKDSKKNNAKLKRLLIIWLTKNFDTIFKSYQSDLNNIYYRNYPYFIYLFIDFLYKKSKTKWLDDFYLSVFINRKAKLYNFFVTALCRYVSKETLDLSLKIAHSTIQANDVIDYNLVILIIKNNDNLNENEINKLKVYLRQIVNEHKRQKSKRYPDPYRNIYTIAYYSTFGKLSRAFDEFNGVDDKFDFLYLYKDFDFSKFNCDWLLPESDSVLSNFFSDKTVKLKIKKVLTDKLKDPDLNQEKKSKFTDIFFKYFADD